MAEFEPVLLKRVDKEDSQSLSGYREDGGYSALAKALEMQPADLVQMVTDSALRGRGGAGFSCGTKWSFLPKNPDGPILMCVNGDESEPGTFNNRILLEEDPHQFLEGTIISCYATRAAVAYIYLRYEYGRSYRVLAKAIEELYDNNLLGKNILGTDFHLDIYLHRGAAAYGLSVEKPRSQGRCRPPRDPDQGGCAQVRSNLEHLSVSRPRCRPRPPQR